MYPQFDAGNPVGHFVHQTQGKLQLGSWVSPLGEGSAHKGLAGFLAQYHLGQDWLVVLNEIRSLGLEGQRLLAQDGDHVLGQVFGRRINLVGQTLKPTGAGQHIGAGQGYLDGPVGMTLQEGQLVQGQPFLG